MKKELKKLITVSILSVSMAARICPMQASASVGRFLGGDLLTQFRTENVPNSGMLVEVGTLEDNLLGMLCGPLGLFMQEDGTFLVTDTYNKVIWKVDKTGSSILAGKITAKDIWGEPIGGYLDGAADQALFGEPWNIVPFMGGYAVSDPANHVIRLIKDGKVRTVAGSGRSGFANGNATTLSVMMDSPTGLAADGRGNLYFSDTGNNAIRKLDESGNVTTCSTEFHEPTGLCYRDGTLYVADSGGNRICSLTGLSSNEGTQPALTTVSGGVYGSGYRDGENAAAMYANPQGILAAADGTVYVADTGNGAVRAIRNGQTTTLLKLDSQSMDVYPVSPVGLALDGDSLYIADSYTRTVLRLSLR